MNNETRFCPDIGLFVHDRPRTSCRHRTQFCNDRCYNVKLEKVFKGIAGKDLRNEIAWQQLTGDTMAAILGRKRNSTARFRFMTRGETFETYSDIEKVKDILRKNPKTLFWIPTRAWRNVIFRNAIEHEIMPFKNARVQASLDPSNSTDEVEEIIKRGWSTMFFGDDTATQDRVMCPKTWKGKKGHCAVCRGGCFSSKQNHIHLKEH